MKKPHDKKIAYTVGGILLMILVGFASLSQGTLLQGNLHFAPDIKMDSIIEMLVPTHQLREGTMPFLKVSLSTGKSLKVGQMNININLKDTRISNVRLLRNDQDITGLLSEEAQKVLKEGLDAQDKSIAKTINLPFISALSPEKPKDIYTFYFNVDNLTRESMIKSSIVEMVIKDGEKERTLTGSDEYTQLEVNYESL